MRWPTPKRAPPHPSPGPAKVLEPMQCNCHLQASPQPVKRSSSNGAPQPLCCLLPISRHAISFLFSSILGLTICSARFFFRRGATKETDGASLTSSDKSLLVLGFCPAPALLAIVTCRGKIERWSRVLESIHRRPDSSQAAFTSGRD